MGEFNELNVKKLELQELYYEFQYMDINNEKDLRKLRFIRENMNKLLEEIFYLECINFMGGK